MWDILFYLLLIVLAAVLIVLGGVVMRSYLNGASPRTALFGARPDPRILVSEQANIDGRRRLLLIRRDDVEHLIMTGGPVDVVIETGIQLHHPSPIAVPQPIQPAFERGTRSFGQKASDG